MQSMRSTRSGPSQSEFGPRSPPKRRAPSVNDVPLSPPSDDAYPMPSAEESEWEVEEIVEIRKRGRCHQALVHWAGFEKPTWEPLKNLVGMDALNNYEARHGHIKI